MKKIVSLLLAVLMIFSVVSLVGCGDKKSENNAENTNLKFGMGVFSEGSVKNAEGDNNGTASANTTAAAVLLDKDGKIVDCVLDTMETTVSFTADGKANTAQVFKTKYELGDDYGMVAYKVSEKEWYEQADAFVKVCKGKTLDEVKKLVANDGTGNDEVVKAGCTIAVTDFVKAVAKAVENAKDSKAVKENSLKLAFFAEQSGAKDATKDAAGANGAEIVISAVVLDADKKVVAATTDTVALEVAFDNKGVSATTLGEIKSKRQLGDAYGMVAYKVSEKEWYEQADAFIEKTIGKTAEEISALLAEDGKGVKDVQDAGCTIEITNMAKATIKAAY